MTFLRWLDTSASCLDTSALYEEIPLADFGKAKLRFMKQLGATQWSSKIEFYRQVRSPRRISDLVLGGKYLIWLDNDSFILNRKLPQSVPHSSKLRKAAADIDFGNTSLYVYGKTDDIVARAIERFLLLKDDHDEAAVVRPDYIFNVAISQSIHGSKSEETPRFGPRMSSLRGTSDCAGIASSTVACGFGVRL